MAFNDLIAMKKSYKKPQVGDVFVLQPLKDNFYFGKVIKTNISSVDSFVNGMTLIYIYKTYSSNKMMIPDLENEELLIAPMIVNNQPWRQGYFETLCNISVSDREKNMDFAFWDVLREIFVDINKQPVKKKPKYWSDFGLGSYGVIGKEVQKAIKK